MKIKHINSGEITEISGLIYTKINGIYGYLVITHEHRIHFVDGDSGTIDHDDITDQYEIINQTKYNQQGKIDFMGTIVNIDYKFINENDIEYVYRGTIYTTSGKSLLK